MKNSKNKSTLFFICLPLLLLITLTGCSTVERKDSIIALQKKRIVSLQRHVQKQDQQIHSLKVNKWTTRDSGWSKRVSLKKLDRLMSKKLWAQALKASSPLSKEYPQWRTLRARRIQIFKAMGLLRQAKKEQTIYSNILLSQKKKKSLIR